MWLPQTACGCCSLSWTTVHSVRVFIKIIIFIIFPFVQCDSAMKEFEHILIFENSFFIYILRFEFFVFALLFTRPQCTVFGCLLNWKHLSWDHWVTSGKQQDFDAVCLFVVESLVTLARYHKSQIHKQKFNNKMPFLQKLNCVSNHYLWFP